MSAASLPDLAKADHWAELNHIFATCWEASQICIHMWKIWGVPRLKLRR